MRTLLLALALLPAPALAERALTAEAFEAIVEGRTLTYGAQGSEPYGMEHYFAGRRVAWAWAGDDSCKWGEWYQEGPDSDPALCFVYEDDPEPKCWRIFKDGDRLRATFLNDGGSTALYEIVEEPGALVCGGVGA